MDSRELGNFGEKKAAVYLRLRGYKILETNFTCRFGEIDLIASKGGFLVFAEVKLRKNADFAEAREFVTPAKQKRIIKTAQYWLSLNDTQLQPRFDVMEVYAPKGSYGPVRINHIEDAFM